MTVATLLPGLLGVAVFIAWLRLARARSAPWRRAVLAVAQPVVAALLWLTLAPPAVRSAGTLVVATHGASLAAGLTGERLVALPEAPTLPGATRVPDLATALRRWSPARLRVVGDGLPARDRDAAAGLAVDFVASPAPRGIVRLAPPPPVAAGAAFAVGGRVSGVGRARVELLDPAGVRVDTVLPDAAGDFVVHGTARAAGPASFALRVADGGGPVETAAVPLWTVAAAPQRVLLLAGAPGPEVKYLRRWATDAGLAVHAEIATGAGLDLGDAPLPLTAATLARFDVAVLDLRRWTASPPAARAAVGAAVRAGLGLVLRVDGPPTVADRAALRPLGFAVGGGDETVPVVLPAVDVPLTRWAVPLAAADATPLLRDAHGATVAAWRAAGTGRVALWPLADSYRLVLAGAGDRYGELWSAALSTVGRGHGSGPPIGPARVGERVVVCGLAGDAAVVAPDGRTTPLLVDPPAAGCAGYWPRVAGWHRLTTADAPFFVAAADALPAARALADAQATRALAAVAAGRAGRGDRQPGSSWPWFVAWLAASAGLWWFERGGRRPDDPASDRALDHSGGLHRAPRRTRQDERES